MKIAALAAASPGGAVGDVPRIGRIGNAETFVGEPLKIKRYAAAFKLGFRKIIAPGGENRNR